MRARLSPVAILRDAALGGLLRMRFVFAVKALYSSLNPP
jgi:hypothetical protein